ncbi:MULTISPECIES: hypothetical protein [Sphingomonadales]|uniref:hypothetical protein n=1 Tax=Sphingomonadales TaxID=204457 RepID=UPI000AC166DA|nr:MULTISPECIES: hypothetical protein [Sphingomonadales]
MPKKTKSELHFFENFLPFGPPSSLAGALLVDFGGVIADLLPRGDFARGIVQLLEPSDQLIFQQPAGRIRV